MSEESQEAQPLTEAEIRSWIGDEIGKKTSTLATKDDLGTAIKDAFSSITPGNNGGDNGGDSSVKDLLEKLENRLGKVESQSSRRREGYLTKFLRGPA